MSGGLQISDGGGGAPARCVRCGAIAAGPCARCHEPVCGDCCVLTEGGLRVFAICLACEDRAGRSLRSGWGAVLRLVAMPIVALALIAALLALLDAR